MIEFTETDSGVCLLVVVQPRASRSQIVGEYNGALKVRIASPPVDGAANAELIRFLAKTFAVTRSDVEILAGHASRTKRVRIGNITLADFRTLLAANSTA